MDKKLLIVLGFLLAMMILVLPAQADGEVQVSLTPDRGELTVGDPVQLMLEVTHPAGYQVIIPQLDQVWGEFEVRGQSQAATTANDDGTETTRQTIEATLFNVGEFSTPSLPLTISDGAGQVIDERVAPISLNVVPTLAEDDMDLRDIKPQASLATPPLLPWIVGGLLAAAILGVVGWWAYRRRMGKPFGLSVVDNRPPWQVALDELARIEGLRLLEQGQFKLYYTMVANALRTYLENQLHLRVLDRTTWELRAIFRQSDIEPEIARRFLDLFGESDLVKFAKFAPEIETARQLTVEARQLVDLTRPQPESELETLLTPDAQPGSGQSGRPQARPASAGA